MPFGNPYLTNPYMQQAMPVMPQVQQAPIVPQYQQQVGALPKVDGSNEAMNRFLMHYPASQLMPGFVSDPMFDVNGKQFYTLSIEQDGRRNLEIFDFEPHVEPQPAHMSDADYVSRTEFQGIVDKVNQLMGALNGIHEPVQATGQTAEQATTA